MSYCIFHCGILLRTNGHHCTYRGVEKPIPELLMCIISLCLQFDDTTRASRSTSLSLDFKFSASHSTSQMASCDKRISPLETRLMPCNSCIQGSVLCTFVWRVMLQIWCFGSNLFYAFERAHSLMPSMSVYQWWTMRRAIWDELKELAALSLLYL